MVAPVRTELPCRTHDEEQVRTKPEEIASIHPVRVQRRNEEVVQPGEGAEHPTRRKPAQEVIRLALRFTVEPDRGDGEQHEGRQLHA